ncbi:ImmA/IrrE family metallo-endopeptidase [Candidatus Sumerlaeota bacterium]|nr:ImmA/IrrE family metallo-endopeptidase [Candidatus Sumerlaeota bacterium]
MDEFILQVAERVSGCGLGNEIRDLFVELKEERADPKLSKACLLQARAGINPGEAADGWLAELENLGQMTGDTSLEEVAAVLPFRKITPQAVREEIESIRDAKTVVDLSQVQKILPLKVQELPWARGSRLAAEFRAMLGLSPDKPILDDSLCDLLKIRLPIKEISPRQSMSGGFRNGQTHIHVSTWRRENQRFYLARLIACALLSGGEERLLPITNSQTALQKAERAFAQEFLCPWTALEPFVEEHGTEEEGISEAAEYFQVSERTIETTLVNKGELPRDAIV